MRPRTSGPVTDHIFHPLPSIPNTPSHILSAPIRTRLLQRRHCVFSVTHYPTSISMNNPMQPQYNFYRSTHEFPKTYVHPDRYIRYGSNSCQLRNTHLPMYRDHAICTHILEYPARQGVLQVPHYSHFSSDLRTSTKRCLVPLRPQLTCHPYPQFPTPALW